MIKGRSYDKNQLQEIVEIKLPKLVDDQKNAFNVIAENLMNHQGRIFFFLVAPGGTIKTFLINLLLTQIRSSGKVYVALTVVSSGIAATLLSRGRTAHLTFKLPLNLSFKRKFVCPIRKNGSRGKIPEETSFVV
ncbi:ATP-dependent DNA helicase [Aphis craccivora]|uniref:ATP-dependent DNA helicase n=1 Tax=Aphis craccivora TaxID=307492 RepID=A0A6G0Z411_APHCR|nr:ATP-dependent DNA helicase [Aphis craccivora]